MKSKASTEHSDFLQKLSSRKTLTKSSYIFLREIEKNYDQSKIQKQKLFHHSDEFIG